VFGFSLHLVPQTIFILQRILRDLTRNVLRSSCKVPKISVRPVPKRKFYENLFTGSHDVPHGSTWTKGWTGRQTDMVRPTVIFCNFAKMPKTV